MNRTEKLTLWAALVGLLVNLIAIANFSGFLPGGSAIADRSGASLFYAIFALIFISYSFVILGYMLLKFLASKWTLEDMGPSARAAQSAIKVFTYLLVAPIYLLWLFTVNNSGAVSLELLVPFGFFGGLALPFLLLFASKALVVVLHPDLEEAVEYAVN